MCTCCLFVGRVYNPFSYIRVVYPERSSLFTLYVDVKEGMYWMQYAGKQREHLYLYPKYAVTSLEPYVL